MTEVRIRFPDPRDAGPDGLVHIGGEISPANLLEAYSKGIFPWHQRPAMWFSPDPRAVFLPGEIHIQRSLRKRIRKGGFHITADKAFGQVIAACREAHRRQGEWIGPQFIRGYTQLHELGHAHSVEVWMGDQLAGGLYGVQLRGLFAGESMFHRVPDASKLAFVSLLGQLQECGIALFDCQVRNHHTTSLGAVDIPRDVYLRALEGAMRISSRGDGSKWGEIPQPAEVLELLFPTGSQGPEKD